MLIPSSLHSLKRLPQQALAAAWLLGLLVLAAPAAANEIQVKVEGLSKPLRENVLASLDWKEINSEGLSESYLRSRLKKSEALVQRALQPFGYYNANVDSQLIALKKGWQAHYQVSTGPLTLISDVNISVLGGAANNEQFQQLQTLFPLQKDDPFVHGLYQTGKADISKKLNANGYLDAELQTATVSVNPAHNSAAITLQWSSGNAYRFGQLHSQSEFIDSRLIQRWAEFESGERFSYEKLLAFQQRLNASGFFRVSQVEIDAKPDEGIADIHVNTEAAAKRLYRASFGYGTDTGARVQLSVAQRWINHYGHSVRLGTRIAEREQSYSANYHVPALRGRADSYDYGWQRRDQQLPEYDSRSDRFSAVELSHSGAWQIHWGINYERDSFTIGTTEQSETLWYVENQWSRFSSNKPVYPDYANALTINGRAGSGFSKNQQYFARLHAQLQWVRPAPWKGRLLLRAAAGGLSADNFGRLPPRHRFYSGGDRNVRGYAYQSLSPVDSNNDHIGGRYLFEISSEIDYRVAESWAVASFVDAGQAFDTSQAKLAVGAGLGLRWISSFLLLKIDVANAISDPQRPWRLHLTLGTDF